MKDATARAADPTSVRRWNERAVLTMLRSGGHWRVAELADATGLTTASVGHVLRTLGDKGWLAASVTSGGPGRPARTYTLDDSQGRLLGLDVGGHTVRGVLAAASGGGLVGAERPVVPAGDAEGVRRAVAQVIDDLGAGDVWAAGLAVSGAMTPDGRLRRSITLPSLQGGHPAELLADLLPPCVLTCHDTKAALWAEHREGAASVAEDVLLVHLGRRPSLALLLGGQPHSGAHGSAGELSLNELLREHDWAPSGVPDPQGEALAAALAGDAAAVRGAQAFLLGLAPQVAFAIGLVDPALVVVGGALAPVVAPALGEFADALATRLEEPPAVVASELDQYAAAQGALDLCRRHVWDALVAGPAGVAALAQESLAAAWGEAGVSGVA